MLYSMPAMIPGRVSVLIPSRNERYLPATARDLLAKAGGDVEIIVVLDGYWPDPLPPTDSRVTLIHRPTSLGMRHGINSAASLARGEFLLKSDAHCLFGEGYDIILKADCGPADVIVPRRYSLDGDAWAIKPDRAAIDYHFLSWAYRNPLEPGLHGEPWRERTKERASTLIDEEMSSQGSCWFMKRTHFWDHLGGQSEIGYERFIQEFQEVGLKTWLGPWGGRVLTNKNTWYAHWHKGKSVGRGYHISTAEMVRGRLYSLDHWMCNRWAERGHDLDWLIDRFWPVPTWPENWREQWAKSGADWIADERRRRADILTQARPQTVIA